MIRFAKGRFYTHTGSPFRNVYKLRVSDKTGAEELVKVGKEDFQEYIDSFADSTDIHAIVARVNAGEVDLLSKSMATYGDFRQMPRTKAEAMQQLIDAKHIWDSLTDSQRSEFEGFSDFAGSAGTDVWIKKLGYEVPEEVKEVKEVAES